MAIGIKFFTKGYLRDRNPLEPPSNFLNSEFFEQGQFVSILIKQLYENLPG